MTHEQKQAQAMHEMQAESSSIQKIINAALAAIAGSPIKSRERSLVATKLEEANLWMDASFKVEADKILKA